MMKYEASFLGLVLLIWSSGCGSSSTSPAPSGAPVLYPPSVYTGFDESGGYAVVVAASQATGIVWTSSDNSIATVAGTDSLGTITGKKAGSTSVMATAGTMATSVMVMVAQYTAADKAAGMSVFMTKGCGASACHGPGGVSDVSPSGIGKHTDAQIIGAANMGLNPEGGMVSSPNHMFMLNADEQREIVTYLRSRASQGTPKPDA